MATSWAAGRWGRLLVGWALLALGLAALVLPGPGLLMIAAGMAILSQQYLWAKRRVAPIRARGIQAAAASVRSWASTTVSVLIALAGVAVGVLWGVRPAAPGWWPLAERWWLPGGWGFGSSMIGSACLALTLIGFSYWRFRIRESPPRAGSTPPDEAARLPVRATGSSAVDLRRNES